MKITKIEVYPLTIPYTGGTYQLSLGGTEGAKKVIIKMFTDEGIVGLGEAAPGVVPDHTGETQEAITMAIKCYLGPLCVGENPFHLEWIMQKLDQPLLGAFGWMRAKCAIDHACWDIMGKALNQPVCELIGGKGRDVMGCTRSLPVQSAKEMARRARQLQDSGYKMVTIKTGFNPEEDFERVAEIRKAVGDDYPLEIDPNQAYRAAEAVQFLRRVERFDILNVEQPVPWYDIEGMAHVRRSVNMSVIADEMIKAPVNAMEVIRREAADVICIKLAKMGGIMWAKKIAAICEGAGMACSMGSSHTLGVGTAAIHHFWASTPNVEGPIGYGSPLERMSDDVLTEPIPFADGEARVPEGPGLGVEIDDKKLKKYGVKVEANLP